RFGNSTCSLVRDNGSGEKNCKSELSRDREACPRFANHCKQSLICFRRRMQKRSRRREEAESCSHSSSASSRRRLRRVKPFESTLAVSPAPLLYFFNNASGRFKNGFRAADPLN